MPQNFAVAYNTGSGNQLTWDDNLEPDLLNYRIYRSADPNFTPGPGNYVESSITSNWTDPDYDGGMVIYYQITAVDCSGNESDASGSATATAVGDPAVPTKFALHGAAPNPFNPTTTIRFDIGAATHVSLRIYDVSGRVVRTLVERDMPQAQHSVVWDGMNDAGDQVSSGVYLYRLSAGNFSAVRKMVMLK